MAPHWQDVMHRDGEKTVELHHLRGLVLMGFPEVAVRVSAGTCPGCGLNRTSANHKASCEVDPAPVRGALASHDPWVARPSRIAA